MSGERKKVREMGRGKREGERGERGQGETRGREGVGGGDVLLVSLTR